MTKFTSKLAAFACTIVFSTTLLFGAVAPATAIGHGAATTHAA